MFSAHKHPSGDVASQIPPARLGRCLYSVQAGQGMKADIEWHVF